MWWRCGGDGIPPEPGKVPALPSPLFVVRPGDRLAMVRTVRTADGTEERRGCQDDRQPAALPVWLLVDRWLCGSDGIPPEPGRVPALPSPLFVVRPGDRLAMVRTVRTSDGAEGEARNWREVGGILRHVFFPFALSSVCLFLFPIYNNVYIQYNDTTYNKMSNTKK